MKGIHEPLRRLHDAARQPAPMIGFERPPPRLLELLRQTAAEAAASTAALARLEAPMQRSCDELLHELSEHQVRTGRRARDVLRERPYHVEPTTLGVLSRALADIPAAVHDAATWWCRSAHYEPELQGPAGALRDATRDPTAAIALSTQPHSDAAAGVRRHVSEGRRLTRRARAVALHRGDMREMLARMSAIAAVERGLASCARAAAALQRLSS